MVFLLILGTLVTGSAVGQVSQLQELDGMLFAHSVAPSGCSADAWIDAVDKAAIGNTLCVRQ